MQDNELSELLSRARAAGSRLDTSRAELAFETRMESIIRGNAQAPGPLSRFQTWLRAVVGLATAVGILAFFFLTTRGEIESQDAQDAFWTGSATVWNMELFN